MKSKTLILVTTALTGFLAAGGVQAQDSATAGAQEVVVVGIRHSLQSSIQLKKKTDSVIDVITAEDVGKFPDTNVAESLSHLPGLAVDRRFGEGEKVSILGTDPALNRLFVDGHSIASADWGGFDGDISGRTFNYTLLAPEIIGQAAVYKSPEAWIDEGSVGGTVMIETRKPLDLKSGTVSGSAGYEYNDRSDKGNMRASALYSWHNAAKTFGILVAATYNKENLYRAGIEYFGYSGGDSFDGSFTTTTDSKGNVTAVSGPNINGTAPTPASYAAMNAARVPCCINFAYFDQTRKRTGLSANVQWKPDDHTEFDLSGLHIVGDYTNFSQSEYSVAVWGEPASDITVANGLVTSAKLGGTGYAGFNPSNPTGYTHYNTSAQLDNNLRRTIVKTDSLNLAGKWNFDAWKISGNVGTTKATGGKDPEYLSSFQYGGGYDFAFSPTSTYQNYTGGNPSDPHTFFKSDLRHMTVNGTPGYYTQIGGLGYEVYTDKETYGQVDFARTLSSGPFTRILFGLKASDHENSTWAHGGNYYLSAPTDLSKWNYTLSPAGLFDGLGASGNATQFATLTRDGLKAMLASAIYSDNGDNYSSIFKVDEMIQAGYLQGNFAVGSFHGNVGGRLVRTRDQSDYWEYSQNNNSWAPRTVTQDDTKFLPNLNLVYDLQDDLLLKGGVAKVIARPRYGQLAGAFSLDNQQMTGGGGNPNLKPYESTNYELSLEHYFGKTGMLAAEAFYRDVSSYVVTDTEDKVLFDTATGANATYSVSSPFNAQNAKVYGLDVQYNKDLLWGFGVTGNVTYAEANTGTTAYYMPFLSKYVVNIIPYYEEGPWQVRVSYNYRTKFFTQIGRRASRDFTADYTQVDLSAIYDINSRISIYAKGLNLLDETYYQYSSVTIAPTSFYKNGRQFMIGFNYKM